MILPYLRRLFETRKAVTVTKKRAEAMASTVEPDEEVKEAYEDLYRSIVQSSADPLNMSEVFRGHCVYSELTELKERFPKERVDVLEKYLLHQRIGVAKPRRRYVKVPSGKRPHFGEMSGQEFVQVNPEAMHPETMISLILCVCETDHLSSMLSSRKFTRSVMRKNCLFFSSSFMRYTRRWSRLLVSTASTVIFSIVYASRCGSAPTRG